MKTKAALLIFFIAVFSTVGYFLSAPRLTYEVLLNRPDNMPFSNLTIFYSDITLQVIKGFKVSPNMIVPAHSKFKSYTEGFLESSEYQFVLSLINNFQKNHREIPRSYFNSYYEDDSLIIISFTGGLENIYVIDKKTSKVNKLRYHSIDNLGAMYVSHIRRIGTQLILTGGEVNAYNTFIYEIASDTLTIMQASKISTHPAAIHKENYTIDSSGNVIFIADRSLQVFSLQAHSSVIIPLPFKADYVFSDAESVIVLSQEADVFKYALLDNQLRQNHIGKLNLPAANVSLVDAFLESPYLYFISYDGINPFYRNYITRYSLTSDKLVYCAGLHPYGTLALLKGISNLAFDRKGK